jgi:signal transduction histidine kinase
MRNRLVLCYFLAIYLIIPLVRQMSAAEKPVPLETKLKVASTKGEKIDILTELTVYYRQKAPEKAVKFGEQALELLNDDPVGDKKVVVLNGLCWAYGVLGQYRKALDTGHQGEILAKNIGDKKELAVAYASLANIYLNLSEFHKALDLSLKAFSLSEELSYKRGAASALVSMARIQRHLREYEKALENYQKALILSKEMNNNRNVAWINNNIATVYWELKQFPTALEYYFKSLSMMNKLKSQIGSALVLNNIASVYSDTGKYIQALEFNLKSLVIYKKLNNSENIAYSYRNIGNDYGRLKQFSKGLAFLDKSMALARQLDAKDLKKSLFEEYVHIHEARGDLKSALFYHKKFKEAGDSILDEARNRRIAHLQVIYDVEKKRKENLLLRKNNHIQELELEQRRLALDRQRVMRNFLILVLLLLVIMALVTFNRYNIKKKAEQILKVSEKKLKQLNDAKDKLFTIIAHDLGNPLNTLLLSSGHLDRHYKQLPSTDVKEFIRDIYRQTQGLASLLENLLQWAMLQTGRIKQNPETLNLFDITNEALHQVYYSAKKKNIHIVPHLLPSTFAWADKQKVKAIIRNLVFNSIKYSHPGGEIIIQSRNLENQIEVSVSDNGIGMDEKQVQQLFTQVIHQSSRGTGNEKGTGLGLLLCKEFVESNGGNIHVHSRIDEGSRISFTLPKNDWNKEPGS